jgi:plastocyanin
VLWLRTGVLILLVGIGLVTLLQVVSPPPAATVAADAGEPPGPTRGPLPTAAPPLVISRLVRETPGAGPTATPSGVPTVTLVDNGYLPGQLTVALDSRVLWLNHGSDGHDVTGTGPGGTWRSGPLAPQEQYERRFSQPGTYDYACTVHPEMRGRLVVQP